MKKYILSIAAIISVTFGQIKITSTEKLPLPPKEYWSSPIFSPSGREIFFTNSEYNGIWQYSLSSKLLKAITSDQNSGFNFVVSDDGGTIAYRRTIVDGDHKTRVQEVVELQLQSLSKTIIDRGNSIQTPVMFNNSVVIPGRESAKRLSTANFKPAAKIIGLVDSKILLVENGVEKNIDPLGNGRYIWPQLSADGLRLAAVDMERGAFISDVSGAHIVRIGKCNAPQWTRSGNWIIGMDDRDDGHKIVGSEIIAVSKDGTTRIQLTASDDQMEMFPAVSMTENKIVVSTATGELLLLTYEEGK